VPQLLAENPALANQRLGEMQTTPLHIAIERNDLELARGVLSAHPNLEIKDAVFHSTPLGWAKHFQRAEILALIQEALTHDPSPSSRRGESL
jgi:ankyrin repeat protein